jgi:hypothetical protein
VASLFFIRFIKSFMVATPFLIMLLMVFALWGIGGKATYTDLNSTVKQIDPSFGEAKNYLVNETQHRGQSSNELDNLGECESIKKNGTTKKETLPEKIAWGSVV